MVKTNRREQLRNIVTRNGKSGRISELLEAELDDLEALLAQAVEEALETLRSNLEADLFGHDYERLCAEIDQLSNKEVSNG